MVRRSRGVMKMIRKVTGAIPRQKFVTAGNVACWKMMREAQPGPSDYEIFICANDDLSREIMTGFWEFRAA